MPARPLYTARAEQDLLEIWAYIANDNPPAADRMLDKIHASCALLAEFPKLGAIFSHAPRFRFMTVGRYLVIYQPLETGIEVARVVHGARHLPHIEV